MKIKAIKRIQKSEEVFDLTVMTNHNYFVSENDILVHNCSKDPSKVDRSGLYAARWIAKHIVSTGLARRCQVQLSYAIGIAEPTSINVETFGTNTNSRYTDEVLSTAVKNLFKLSPKWIIDKFNLTKPSKDTFTYSKVAMYGQVGENRYTMPYPWEVVDTEVCRAILDEAERVVSN